MYPLLAIAVDYNNHPDSSYSDFILAVLLLLQKKANWLESEEIFSADIISLYASLILFSSFSLPVIKTESKDQKGIF